MRELFWRPRVWSAAAAVLVASALHTTAMADPSAEHGAEGCAPACETARLGAVDGRLSSRAAHAVGHIPPLAAFLDTSDFPRRWNCGTWTAAHGWTHIVSDIAIWGAYMAIPIGLAYFIRRRRDMPFPPIFWLFCAFIAACGTVHLVEAFIFWDPIYRINAAVKVFTAVASWVTVAALIPVIPKALTLPGLAKLTVELETRVASRTAELRSANEALQQEVAERKRGEMHLLEIAAKLERSNAELERSNRELQDFAYIASHDLKEPLRGIENYSRFLFDDYADRLDDEGRRKLETLPKLTARMEELIECLLQYSRVGSNELELEDVDLQAVVAETIENLEYRVKDSSVEVRVPRDLPVVRCDRVRAGEIFANLVSNAIKYSDQDRRWVEIGWTETDPLTFYVRDNGIGIKEKHQEKIFSIFRRLHGKDKYGGGSGAGLTIVKRIVEKHGGRVWIESEKGEGATFLFTLDGKSAGTDADPAPHAPEPPDAAAA